jgi:hypothetical protein
VLNVHLAGTSSWARLNCGRGIYCPDGSAATIPCSIQIVPVPYTSWALHPLTAQGPAFLVETSSCLNHCFWNFTSGDGMLSTVVHAPLFSSFPYQKTRGRELDLFLKQREAPKGAPVTHCGAGTWNIPPEDELELRRLIADAQHVPYVVEDTLSSGCAPLVLDLDFNAPVEPAGE